MIPMSDMNKNWNNIDNENEKKVKNGVIFKRPIMHDYCPLSCNSCGTAISSIEDVNMMKKEKVCEDCYITHYFVNKEKWKDGWRPSKKTN